MQDLMPTEVSDYEDVPDATSSEETVLEMCGAKIRKPTIAAEAIDNCNVAHAVMIEDELKFLREVQELTRNHKISHATSQRTKETPPGCH